MPPPIPDERDGLADAARTVVPPLGPLTGETGRLYDSKAARAPFSARARATSAH